MGLFQQASRKRITVSLNTDIPSDKSILDFLSGLPRRTRSEIIKEILFEALDKTAEIQKAASPSSTETGDPEGIDPDEIIEKLF